jgi:hypothetical protein
MKSSKEVAKKSQLYLPLALVIPPSALEVDMFLSLLRGGFMSSLMVHDVERYLPRAATALFSDLRAAEVDRVLDLAESDLFDAVDRFLDLLTSGLFSFSFLVEMLELDLFLTCDEDTLLSTLLFSLDILLASLSTFFDSEAMDDARLLGILNLDFLSSPGGFLVIGVLVRRLVGGAEILDVSGVANFDAFNLLLPSDWATVRSDDTLFDFVFPTDLLAEGVARTDRGATTLVDFVLLFFANTSFADLLVDFGTSFP